MLLWHSLIYMLSLDKASILSLTIASGYWGVFFPQQLFIYQQLKKSQQQLSLSSS